MSRRARTTLVGVAAAALVLAGGASGRDLPLPSPTLLLTPTPPLLGGPLPRTEGIRHRVTAAEQVRVEVDGRGRPVRVSAVQRLDVRGLGDYVFAIPVPARRATAAPGSRSAPGLRTDQLLWNGFNPGRKVLGAVLDLDPARTAAALPFRVRLVRTPDSTRVVLANVTGVNASALTADVEPRGVLRYLDTLRDAAAADTLPPPATAHALGPTATVFLRVLAPLRVRGTVRAGALVRHVDALLGGGGPPSLSLVFPRGAKPRASLAVEPVAPMDLLTPPGRVRRWRDVRGVSGRALLARATAALLALDRARQYDQFVGNPDPVGSSSTRYTYVTVQRAAAAPRAAGPSGSGDGGWHTPALALVGVFALAGGAALWARA